MLSSLLSIQIFSEFKMDMYVLDTMLRKLFLQHLLEILAIKKRAEYLKRRKELYEAKYPNAKAGVKRTYGMNKALGNNVNAIMTPTFTKDTANKLNVSPRTVQNRKSK
jgi:hypothetical protein